MNPAGVKIQSPNLQHRGSNPVAFIAQNIPVSDLVSNALLSIEQSHI